MRSTIRLLLNDIYIQISLFFKYKTGFYYCYNSCIFYLFSLYFSLFSLRTHKKSIETRSCFFDKYYNYVFLFVISDLRRKLYFKFIFFIRHWLWAVYLAISIFHFMVNIYNLFAKIYVHEGPLWITKGRISMDIENDLQLFSRINPRILRRFLHTHSTSKMWYTVVLIALKIPPKNNTKTNSLSAKKWFYLNVGGGGRVRTLRIYLQK